MSDKGRKSLRAAKKAARRIRVQRDKEVTKRGGNEAHRMCGRKKRYPNKVAAEMIAVIYPTAKAGGLTLLRAVPR